MRLKVLGCSGGIGGNLNTTSLLVDNDMLIDAGTGVGELQFDELKAIDHIFITHSHLDHITNIPFLVDTVGAERDKPVTLYGLSETLEALHKHIFNWEIWPDFSVLPSKDQPYLRFQPIKLGETIDLSGRKVTALPANHVVPAVGYQLDSGKGSLVFSGDTAACDAFWETVNHITNLRYLIIETAFCNRDHELAAAAKHYCPSLLAEDLRKLQRPVNTYITHLKPNEIKLTMQEVTESSAEFNPHMLKNNQIFEF